MIVNYQLEPKQSPIFIASFIMNNMKKKKNFDELFNLCIEEGFYYSNTVLAFGLLYLLKKINGIDREGFLK